MVVERNVRLLERVDVLVIAVVIVVIAVVTVVIAVVDAVGVLLLVAAGAVLGRLLLRVVVTARMAVLGLPVS